MKTFFKWLEIFDTNVPINVDSDPGRWFWKADFEADGVPYTFSARKTNNGWEIGFYFKGKPNPYALPKSNEKRGDATTVFSGVYSALTKFIEQMKPKAIFFTATRMEPSRIKLYDKLAPILAKRLGWRFNRKSGVNLPDITYEITAL